MLGLFNDNKRAVRGLTKIANRVMDLEEEFAKMTDKQLQAETQVLKKRVQEDGEKLNSVLPRAFALVREACWRVLGMKPFKVQIIGGIALHQGRIAEMKTGEGKTLVSVAPAFLNALTGKGVHIITVNEYLAKRDGDWMGKVHRFLGLTIGCSTSGLKEDAKRKAYAADITYATNSEIGFDYLRDNICGTKEQRVLRGTHFAIVDEVDSILIDEARTPLIISGPGSKPAKNYEEANKFIKTLKPADYDYDIEKKQLRLTDEGVSKAEKFYKVENLGDIENLEIHHYINNALRAHVIMHKDKDYIKSEGEILIVDEHTGRVLEGRRYNDGLHQAIEAKEGVEIQNENQTMATITYQNLFRMYKKLSGMTGTAKTEEGEFNRIYNLDVVTIPTNLPMIRKDDKDIVFGTIRGKFSAVLEDALAAHEKGQPVLIGTANVDRSEELSQVFRKQNIKHNVLNAKNHMREAEIIAQAGKKGAITISTNMAGRGTDILLGGNADFMSKEEMRKQGFDAELIESATAYLTERTPEEQTARDLYERLYKKYKEQTEAEKKEVQALGGLRVIGTERHESRRIDNQLRGRAGRQGDPGESIFYISLEDEIIKRFGGDRLKRMLSMSINDEYPLNYSMLGWMIGNAQKKIEGINFTIRRYTLEYDDVLNKQRTLIYEQRNAILDGEDVRKSIVPMCRDLAERTVRGEISDEQIYSEWNLEKLNKVIDEYVLAPGTNFLTPENIKRKEVQDVVDMIVEQVEKRYEAQWTNAKAIGFEFASLERQILLGIVDRKWIDHIDAMTILKNDIGLRSHGQQDPLIAYRRESQEMYETMINGIHDIVAKLLLNIHIARVKPMEQRTGITAAPQFKSTEATQEKILDPMRERPNPMESTQVVTGDRKPGEGGERAKLAPVRVEKVAERNDPCPCGSGRKYKQCCINK
ncbi:MAG: preprotein translocase subunit SecA [Firmicutes bacterium]|nr:preprotein translocase subunit SecA [Bacillota bacterium]MCL2770989.1 preprotein translocase subunit SecA [Bacillota bacterium]